MQNVTDLRAEQPNKVVILVGSPRRNGNSAHLAKFVERGVAKSGAQPVLRFADEFIRSFLRDCRTCRLASGECSIEDGFREVFFEDFLAADGIVICSPIYWYGLSAQTKAFFDRTFCYYASSYPGHELVHAKMTQKKIGLVLTSEETYPGGALGIIHQIQEFSRYTRSEFVGVVRGIGNSRGEVSLDPNQPEQAAEQLGRELLSRPYSDYSVDSQRETRVWSQSA